MPQGVIGGSRPDLTPAQLIAGIPILAELLHTFGVYNLSQPQQDSLGKGVTFCFALLGADAAVRIGRNLKDGKVESSALLKASEPPVGPTGTASTDGEPSHVAAEAIVAEAPLDPEEVAGIESLDEGLEDEFDLDLDGDFDVGEDPELDDDIGPIGVAASPENNGM